MAKDKIQEREIIRKQFFTKCEICGEEITGTGEEHLKKNLEIHISLKHKEKSKEK